MEVNDFDKLVKEQMSKMEVFPSKGTKKALVFKMFFNNLFLFHKVKLVAAFFLISGGVYLGVNYSENGESLFAEANSKINKEAFKKEVNKEEVKKEADVNDRAIQNNNLADYSGKNTDNSEVKLQKDTISKQNINNYNLKEEDIPGAFSLDLVKESEKKETNNSIKNTTEKLITLDQEQSKAVKSVANIREVIAEEHSDKKISEISNSKIAVVGSNLSNSTAFNSDNNFSLETIIPEVASIQKFDIIHPVVIETEIVLNNSLPTPIVIQPLDDYVTNPKKRGFTVDAYYSTLNKVDVDNTLDDDLSDYHWDFYKEHDYVKTGSRGGVNINYNWNNFKIGSGIQLSTLRDYKSVYKYYFMQGSSSGGITQPNVSSAVVYGEDTAQVFYADPLNHELHREIENEYNTYTYIKVPLTLGYELDFKYLSLELNAGVEYGHLINSSGIEVKRGNVVNDPVPVYFYSDKYVGMMSRKSENLNKHQFAVLANATIRVRLSPSFDLYSSVNYTQSNSGVYQDNYFMQKTYKNYGAKIGVTYYLNKRLKFKETTLTSF
ncbi:hypothetical protein OAN33_03770 [Flavobacteriales bacterium]|nr:hypothetical protein [Flavobacteriales bacterium]